MEAVDNQMKPQIRAYTLYLASTSWHTETTLVEAHRREGEREGGGVGVGEGWGRDHT